MAGLHKRQGKPEKREIGELCASPPPPAAAQYPCPCNMGSLQRLVIPNGTAKGVRTGAKLWPVEFPQGCTMSGHPTSKAGTVGGEPRAGGHRGRGCRPSAGYVVREGESKGGLGETQPCFYIQVPTRVGALEKLWNKHSWAVYH